MDLTMQESSLDCELEFAQVPNRVFRANFARLGLAASSSSASVQIPRPPVTAQPSAFTQTIRLTVHEQLPFPQSLVLAFRVCDNALLVDELEGLSRLIESGIRTMSMGITPYTELRSVLAAMALQSLLGSDPAMTVNFISRAKALAREALEDVLLVRDTFRQLRLKGSNTEGSGEPTPSAVAPRPSVNLMTESDKLSAALSKIAKLERENERLLKALEQAYRPCSKTE